MEEEFYQKIDEKLKSILDHTVPELLLRENKNINNTLKTILGEKDMSKDLPKGKLGEKLSINNLIIKNYDIIKIHSGGLYDCITKKDGVKVLFEIKTDFVCGNRPDNINVALELRTWPDKHTGCRKGSLLKTEAKFIGYNLPRQDMSGFISTKKILNIIHSEVVRNLKKNIDNLYNLNETQKKSLSLLKQDDLETTDTFDLIERFIDFLPSWYERDSLDYKISPNSGDPKSGGINLLMPFEEFKKHFQILNI